MINVRRAAGLAVAAWIAVLAILGATASDEYVWNLPAGFPTPPVPADNPMTTAKAALGRHLFYDTRLSANGTQSCASCHQQERAFTDGRAQSAGSTGEQHPRSSMSLANSAYASTLTWGNPTLRRLEDQALVPMYGDHPIELGLNRDDKWLTRVSADPIYQRLFAAAFPAVPSPFTRDNVVKAIATFERTMISGRSPYDRYHYDRDDAAVSAQARHGEVLFHSRQLQCFTCHGGFNFTDAVATDQARRMGGGAFHNTGLYNLAGALSYPAPNTGIFESTGNPRDVGRFKTPSLRNVAVTAPYFHDGSAATLDDAIAHYAAGGRTITDGPLKGVGHDNPNKDVAIQGFTLTADERADLIAFLKTLTDTEFLTNPALSNPWTSPTR